MTKIVECIPNFSEGRRLEVVEAVVDEVKKVEGVKLLNYSADPDHNRSVVTFIGEPKAAKQAAFNLTRKAVGLIDINLHEGVHPWVGAVDVIPFVPLKDMKMKEAVKLAHELGEEIAGRLEIPVYFYGEVARDENRRSLADVRRGGFERLKEEIDLPERCPDVGEAKLHPKAGAVAIGARNFLIAFNVNLDSSNLDIAKAIAKSIREKHGGLSGVKALGVKLESRGLVQVTMNITDHKETSLARVMDFIRLKAKEYNVGVLESELIGLIPEEAVFEGMKEYLQLESFDENRILENYL